MVSVHYSYAQTATQEFDKVFEGKRVFENPKHYADLSRLIEYLTGPDDLVLDFFAGSCSTAHAILATNHSRQSARHFICVQLPEPVNASTHAGQNALELGLKTIADIGKERIRRVITRINSGINGQPGTLPEEDLGFKVFKLAPSNFRLWEGVKEATPEQYVQQMALYNDSLVEGWTPEKVIEELALKEGYSFTSYAKAIEGMVGQTIYRVVDPDRNQSFTVCLDDHIDAEKLEPLAIQKDDLFICRDSALDDEAAANLALQCRLKLI
jgi:adenine-specific DNA-methyltransferase